MRPSLTFWLAIIFLMFVAYEIITPKIYSGSGGALTHAHADIRAGIKSALGQYNVDVGHYPKSFQDLVQKPDEATNWHGPYFEPPKVPTDPWGHEYIYEFPGKHNPGSYDVMSAGPDGKKRTEDDISNWDK